MSAFDNAHALLEEVKNSSIENAEELEQFRIRFLGSKNVLKSVFPQIKEVEPAKKKEFGQLCNSIKQTAEEKFNSLQSSFGKKTSNITADFSDITLPVSDGKPGALHPLTKIEAKIIDIFRQIGFTIAEGPEIEDDWHNFSALNIPEDHPAREMQDTFFVQKDPTYVLRTHTSPVQIRTLLNNTPPIRVISPGRVYRADNDATHSPVFHQVEGIYVAEKVSFADLKQTLYYFVTQMFGEGTGVRFRPSFFPFTEPSAEMDIAFKKDGEEKWMEILGCGMVDPEVLRNCNIDPDRYMGFAFGMGVERIAMLKYGIQNIRLFYENDLRFLEQFKAN